MNRRNLWISILGAMMIISAGNAIMNVRAGDSPSYSADPAFIFGTGAGPVDLDPHYMWDSASADVADQVCEPLYANALDANMALIPRLAVDDGQWSDDGLTFTVKLRRGVKFHDGADFNAQAVKWNFDRLMGFIERGETQITDLYEPIDEKPVINATVVIDDYTVQFRLNYVYAPFKALLAFTGSYIMSPESTPADRLLQAGNDTLVGTGPFKYIEYIVDEKVEFQAFEDYWGGAPAIKKLIFNIIQDSTTRNQALLNNEIHMIDAPHPDFTEQFDSDPYVVLSDGPDRVAIQYLGMNNKKIDLPVRRAISHAFNYTYLVEEIMKNGVNRMNSVVPKGIAYHTDDCNTPNTDVIYARQILVDAGLANGLDVYDDDAWISKAEGTSPIMSLNYTYNTENSVRASIGTLVQDNLKKIGIKVTIDGITWAEYVGRLFGDKDKLDLFFIGWIPDINDPSNFMDILLKSDSWGNSAQVNDSTLDNLLDQAIRTVDPEERENLYKQAQCRVTEEIFPWVYGYVGKGYDAWRVGVTGFQQNPLGKFWFANVELEGVFEFPETGTTQTESTEEESTEDESTEPNPLEIAGYAPVALAFTSLSALALVIVAVKRKQKMF